jgi:hypothetical protein
VTSFATFQIKIFKKPYQISSYSNNSIISFLIKKVPQRAFSVMPDENIYNRESR